MLQRSRYMEAKSYVFSVCDSPFYLISNVLFDMIQENDMDTIDSKNLASCCFITVLLLLREDKPQQKAKKVL